MTFKLPADRPKHTLKTLANAFDAKISDVRDLKIKGNC